VPLIFTYLLGLQDPKPKLTVTFLVKLT
jgi:hypothetical protein